MDIDSYLLFIFASIILCIVPGPDMVYLLSRSIAQGKRAGVMAALGINVGAYVHLFAAIIGLSAILATSAFAFTVIKWLGAAYLIYIGIQAILSSNPLNLETGKLQQQKDATIFWQGFLSDVLNPKVALFFLAFLPQFIEPNSNNPTLQLLTLGLTVNIIGITTNLLLVYFSALVTKKLRNNKLVSRWLSKVMGSIFILLGFKLANEKM